MKKILTLFAAATLALGAMAQEQGFYGNKFLDNWYIGVEGGAGTVTTHQALLENLNGNFGMRVGKLFSPVVGFGVEANAFTSNTFRGTQMNQKTALKYHQLGLYATFNLINAFKGYYGEPRKFEFFLLPEFAWGQNHGTETYGAKKNMLVNKLAMDICFNFGGDQAWTLYLEPALNYVIAGTREAEIKNGVGNRIVLYDINSSFVQLNLGLNYKFKTSNGTHNFAVVEACNQMEIEELNNQVNELRDKAKADEETIVSLQKEQDELEVDLEACEHPEPEVVKPAIKEPDLPAVFYQLDKSIITPAQQPNVAIAAEVLKNHPEYDLHIKGYASPEGPHANNTSLGIRRANAVRTMLINKYKIDPRRIKAEGCGETDELFPVFEFNRVAVMFLERREK